VAEALAVVDLTGAGAQYPAELSGGMRKRVGIARAIALRPRYILYDEPTTGLDPVTSAVIDRLIVRTRERFGVTAVVVTHDMRSAYTVGDRIAMLYEGRIRQVGTVAEVQATEDPVVRQFIEGRPT
jgi:phospholipid/cholesterol/gamma-HCH transport system ATP-binding protein